MGVYDFTFYDLISRNAVSYRDKTAWFEVDDSRTLSFSQYKERVDRLAEGLRISGLEKGDRIGVLGKNSLEYFLLYGAAAALGAILLPLNWRLSAEEIVFNLSDCEPRLLFVDQEYQQMIAGLKPKLPSLESFYNLKADTGEFLGFESLSGGSGPFKPAEVSSDDGVVIIHTAAVAGRPRGALLSHSNLINANIHLNCLFNLSSEDVHLNLLPLFHVMGLFMATNTFHAGALNVNVSKFEAEQAVGLIEEQKVSVLFDFSPILASILEACQKKGKNIESLKLILGIDSPDTIEKYQEVTGGTFYCIYGQTETSSMATLGSYNDRPGSAGKTIKLADVKIVDDSDRPLPPGETGEITVKGPLVFKGYWNLPEENRRTFRNGRHHTGDLGRFDEDGFLWYEGRKTDKELIKPGGENVYPAEVENAIREHPAVAATVVFGVPDPKWKEGIKAVCRLKPDQDLKPRQLIRFVGERIASYKKPQYVEFVKDFPVLPDGSPDRARIKAMYGGAQDK
jgi:long-chain acyl-CoA synthetase